MFLGCMFRGVRWKVCFSQLPVGETLVAVQGAPLRNAHITRMKFYVGSGDQFYSGWLCVCLWGGGWCSTTDVFPRPVVVGKPHLVLVAVQGAP
ncbi:hypothetical protein BC826DRAFT_994239, partial [Russula brevipes]